MNLAVWDKLKTPPPNALKPISGGRLTGKTDINPVWRLKALTEQFGQCGVGWKFEIVQTWFVDGSDGQKMLYMQINLFTKQEGDEWSAPIPGFGGDFLIVKEKGGLHSNDEAFKMAGTDALGNAMKNLGVAADVYWEKGRESKYTRENAAQNPRDGAGAAKGDSTHTCSECSEIITEAVYKMTIANPKMKRPLCQKCQKKVVIVS